MRKYWYYVMKTSKGEVWNVCYSDDGEFPLSEELNKWSKLYPLGIIIKYWHEISSAQYKKLSKYFEKTNK